MKLLVVLLLLCGCDNSAAVNTFYAYDVTEAVLHIVPDTSDAHAETELADVQIEGTDVQAPVDLVQDIDLAGGDVESKVDVPSELPDSEPDNDSTPVADTVDTSFTDVLEVQDSTDVVVAKDSYAVDTADVYAPDADDAVLPKNKPLCSAVVTIAQGSYSLNVDQKNNCLCTTGPECTVSTGLLLKSGLFRVSGSMLAACVAAGKCAPGTKFARAKVTQAKGICAWFGAELASAKELTAAYPDVYLNYNCGGDTPCLAKRIQDGLGAACVPDVNGMESTFQSVVYPYLGAVKACADGNICQKDEKSTIGALPWCLDKYAWIASLSKVSASVVMASLEFCENADTADKLAYRAVVCSTPTPEDCQ